MQGAEKGGGGMQGRGGGGRVMQGYIFYLTGLEMSMENWWLASKPMDHGGLVSGLDYYLVITSANEVGRR